MLSWMARFPILSQLHRLLNADPEALMLVRKHRFLDDAQHDRNRAVLAQLYRKSWQLTNGDQQTKGSGPEGRRPSDTTARTTGTVTTVVRSQSTKGLGRRPR